MSVPPSLEAAVQDRLRNRQTYGLAIAAFNRDRELFAGGVGYADVASGTPVEASTIFRVASISKLLTASLVLRLASSGVLDLEAPVNDYLPPNVQIIDQRGDPASSPLKTLLSHSSGLPFGVRGAAVGGRVMSYIANQGTVTDLAGAITGLQLTYEVGSKVVYSNPAYNVLGYLAARALGGSFEEVVTDQVLGPLNMNASEFASRRSGPDVATQYGSLVPPRATSKPADGLRLIATPMGGLTTNVNDLARFGQMLLGSGKTADTELFDPEVLSTATSLQARNHPDLDHGYGLGFKVRPWRGRTVIGHDGNMPGVATQLAVSPDDGVGVVVLTNGYPLSVPHEIADLALEHVLGLDSETKPRSPDEVPADHQRATETLGRKAQGTYRTCDLSPRAWSDG